MIYAIFFNCSDAFYDKIHEDTFGANVIQFERMEGNWKKENFNVAFLQFNTSWDSLGGKQDIRKLRVGEFQIDRIKKEYESVAHQSSQKNKSVDLTIALAHHPLHFLTGEEEDLMRGALLGPDIFDAALYLCGHVHDREAINWQNNRQSLTTLITGLGWPLYPYSSERHAFTYSFYDINLDYKSIEIHMRTTNEKLEFEPDLRMYTDEYSRNNMKIVMPLYMYETHAYYTISGVDTRKYSYFFTPDDAIHLSEYTRIVSNLSTGIEKYFNKFKYIIAEGGKTRKQRESLLQYFFENTDGKNAESLDEKLRYYCRLRGYTNFFGFLQAVVQTIGDEFCDAGYQLRAYFRAYNETRDIYEKRCISMRDTNMINNLNAANIEWNGMIEKVYQTERKALISSAGRIFFESKQRDIELQAIECSIFDHIEIIPQFRENIYSCKRVKNHQEKQRPILSLGIDIFNQKDKWILRFMDSFEFGTIIGKNLQEYFNYLSFDLGLFCSEIKGGDYEKI